MLPGRALPPSALPHPPLLPCIGVGEPVGKVQSRLGSSRGSRTSVDLPVSVWKGGDREETTWVQVQPLCTEECPPYSALCW